MTSDHHTIEEYAPFETWPGTGAGGAVPQFAADALPLDYDESLGGNAWQTFRKTTPTRMVRIDRPFAVTTIHGGEVQEGKAGDWLAVDAEGHPYPIAATIVEQTFEVVPDPPSPDLEPAAPFSLEELHAQLAATSDYERGRLLELVGGASGVVGALTRAAAYQFEGFPADVKVAALLLLAVGIVDQAGPADEY